MEKYAAEDGLESFASSGVEESDEEPDHHLLTMPNGDVEFLFDKPVKLSRELMWFGYPLWLYCLCVNCLDPPCCCVYERV